MKNFVDNEIINTPWRDEVIPNPNTSTTNEYVYHTTKNFEDLSVLKVGDKLTLNASEAALGYGLYWSNRVERIYGNTSFVLKGITARKVAECEYYTWYRCGDVELVIDDIDEESGLIYVSLIDEK